MAVRRPVHTITATTVTAEAFSPFGEVLEPTGPPLPHVYGDALDVYRAGTFESDAKVEFIATRSRLRELRVQYLERHRQITQTFIPLGGHPILLVVAPPDAALVNGIPALEDVGAFVVPADRAVNIWRGTWHEVPFPLVDQSVSLVTSHSGVTDGWAELGDDREIVSQDEEKRDVSQRTGTELVVEVPTELRPRGSDAAFPYSPEGA